MDKSFESKPTRPMRTVNVGMVMDVCSEQDCGITILVEQEEKGSHKNMCMSCMMRAKLRGRLK